MKPDLNEDFEFIHSRSGSILDRLRNRRILLTGGTGFFGKWILGYLEYANRVHGLGVEVLVLSRDPERFLGAHPEFRSEKIHFIQGDIRKFALEGMVDYVIHGATEASASLNASAPLEMFDVIVSGTKRLLKVCESAKPSRILLISSGAVYGKQDPNVVNQSDDCMFGPDVHDAASSYAEGKRVSELLGAFHNRMTAQEVTFARCFAFVGPHLPLDSHFAMGNFIRDCLIGNEIKIKGDGMAHRSYLYAADLVVWLLQILIYGKNLRSYNVGSEESLSIHQTAQAVAEVWFEHCGNKVQIHIGSKQTQEAPIHRYVPSTERARKELGLEKVVSLREAIRRSIIWAKKMQFQEAVNKDCSDSI